MTVFALLRTRPAALAAATALACPLCVDAPLLAGELMCHGCRSEARRLGEGRA